MCIYEKQSTVFVFQKPSNTNDKTPKAKQTTITTTANYNNNTQSATNQRTSSNIFKNHTNQD